MAVTFILLCALFLTPFGVIIGYYSIGYNILQRLVDPSFSFHYKRLSDLWIGFIIISIINAIFINVTAPHFHFPKEFYDTPIKNLLPFIIYIFIRSLCRFQSSRLGRDHLNIIVFSFLIGVYLYGLYTIFVLAANFFPIIVEVGINLHHYIVPHFSNIDMLVIIFLSFLLLIFEWLFSKVPKIKSLEKNLIKESKWIDITEELPIPVEFISGKKDIGEKIKDLITPGSNGNLSIITNTYSTIIDNIDMIKNRSNRSQIRILGSNTMDIPIAKARKQAEENLQNMLEIFACESNICVCESTFDDVRVIIDGEEQIMVSFATGGYRGSHVGVYSRHPFMISLFKNYFNLKCKKRASDGFCNGITTGTCNCRDTKNTDSSD